MGTWFKCWLWFWWLEFWCRGLYNPGVQKTIVDRELPYVGQEGDANCGPACGESSSRGVTSQDLLRALLEGDPNISGVYDTKLWDEWSKQTGRPHDFIEKGLNKSSLFESLQMGFDISVSTTWDGSNGHAVMINKATKQSTTVFGIPVTRYTFHTMNPASGGGAYIPTPKSMLVNTRCFLLFPLR